MFRCSLSTHEIDSLEHEVHIFTCYGRTRQDDLFLILVKHSVDLINIIISTMHNVLEVMDEAAVIHPTVPKTEYFEEDTKPPISINKNKQQRFTCQICNFEFQSKSTFYNHKKIVHLQY